EIVSTSDTSFTYRERIPARVAADPDAGLYHAKRCPAVKPHMQWIAPAAATLRKLRPHSCATSLPVEFATKTEAREPRDPGHIAVLYLGNSLVYYNEIPRMTSAIAAREARPLRVDSVTRSGVSLEQLWNETAALKRIWQEHWDYVVVQGGGGGVGPLRRADEFTAYLERFVKEIRKSGATPVLYMVWSLQRPAEMEKASLALAKPFDMKVAPVAIAWHELLRLKRFPRLDWDTTHPDAFGAYLVACTVYSTIYGKPAHGAPHDFAHLAVRGEVYDDALREQRLTPEDARAIQDAAWWAVRKVR
ncbi:MAG TPA: hypothetical protein VHK90_11775, partial [Thermoanaerobaculia bacterium]|nr:hypothetical protein [Thermoanaerobaculia bacterium]